MQSGKETQVLSKPGQLRPFFHETLTGVRIPFLFDLRMTAGPLAGALVMAEPALERLVAGAEQLAQPPGQKRASVWSMEIGGERGLAAPESRGEDAKFPVG